MKMKIRPISFDDITSVRLCLGFDTMEKQASSSSSSGLLNLPSRGLFSSSPTVPSSSLGPIRVYVCEHDTSPPSEQVIKTDQMNILIRSLLLKKQAHSDSRKRASGSGSDPPARSKRPATGEGLTVERLRIALREKGLSVKGKKDQLIARLSQANQPS